MVRNTVEPLKQNDPNAAKFLEEWQNQFEKSYDFSKKDDQVVFVEAINEIAKHIATRNKTATLELSISQHGVVAVVSQTAPPKE